MKFLVCGDRAWSDGELVNWTLWKLSDVFGKKPTIIEGEAPGADTCARETAEHYRFPVNPFPADWGRYGKGAGPIRNSEMLRQEPDLTVGYHDNIEESKGTFDMLYKSVNQNIPTILIFHCLTEPPYKWKWWGEEEIELLNLYF